MLLGNIIRYILIFTKQYFLVVCRMKTKDFLVIHHYGSYSSLCVHYRRILQHIPLMNPDMKIGRMVVSRFQWALLKALCHTFYVQPLPRLFLHLI